MMNICMFLLETEFKEDGFDDDTVMTMAEVEDPYYPLDLKSMREAQLNDKDLIRIMKNRLSGSGENNTVYIYKTVEDVKLIHKNNQILVPRTKQQSVLGWNHTILIHPGEARMIKQAEKLVKTCHECQMCKKVGKKKYGLLPPKNAESMRQNRVNVDLWGPKSVVNVNGYTYELHIMTMVDPVTGWFEQRQLYDEPNAYTCQQILDSVWISRYPHPKEIGFKNGFEFKMEF